MIYVVVVQKEGKMIKMAIYLLNDGIKVTCLYCNNVVAENNDDLCQKCINEGFN